MTASPQLAAGHITDSAQTWLVQSSGTAQARLSAHAGQEPPPQSTSVSSPFIWLSSHDGAAHTLLMQLLISQSLFCAHAAASPQGLQIMPPQSMSDSSWLSRPSSQVGAGSVEDPVSSTCAVDELSVVVVASVVVPAVASVVPLVVVVPAVVVVAWGPVVGSPVVGSPVVGVVGFGVVVGVEPVVASPLVVPVEPPVVVEPSSPHPWATSRLTIRLALRRKIFWCMFMSLPWPQIYAKTRASSSLTTAPTHPWARKPDLHLRASARVMTGAPTAATADADAPSWTDSVHRGHPQARSGGLRCRGLAPSVHLRSRSAMPLTYPMGQAADASAACRISVHPASWRERTGINPGRRAGPEAAWRDGCGD